MAKGIKIFVKGLAFTALAIGCSTTPTHKGEPPPQADLLPPKFNLSTQKDVESVDYFLLKSLDKADSRNKKWWIRYKRGMIWSDRQPELSCVQFSALAKEPLFPLARIAHLRALQVCPAGSQKLANFAPLELEALPSWQKNLGLEAAIRRAELDANMKRLMQLSFEKSKLPLRKEEKVELTERARKIAESIGNSGFAFKMKKRMESLRPSLMTNPSRRDWIKVAYDYRRQRKFDIARKYYRKVLNHRRTSFSQKLTAYQGLRKSYKNERRMEEYLKMTLKTALFVEKSYRKNPRSPYYKHLFHDKFVTLARAQWTLGKVSDARRTLKIVEKVLARKYPMAEVYWLFGRMAEEKRQFPLAINWFRKALAEQIASDEFKEKIHWYLAWNQRKIGKHQDALATLGKIIDLTDNDFAKSRYQFWLGQTLNDSGDTTRAALAFQELINDDPLGYYGLLAHYRTGQLIPASQAPPQMKPLVLEKSEQAKAVISRFVDLQVLDWLISLEEHELAKRYLNAISADYRKSDQQDEIVWLEIFNYYGKAGEYLSLFEQLGNLSPERRKFILAEHPGLLFPRPFAELVSTASERTGVQPELIYSIMRQESAFNPRARSYADAYGLLQMLPENAAKEPVALSLNYQKATDLYKPEINIPVGAAFLQKITVKWNRQFILMVASYNANDKAIRGWIKTRFRGDPVEFIEDIPYEETRGYIRLVMRNLIFYSLLNSGGEKIPFPSDLLRLDSTLDNSGVPPSKRPETESLPQGTLRAERFQAGSYKKARRLLNCLTPPQSIHTCQSTA
jgi:soluble lytic murein transglycosylase